MIEVVNTKAKTKAQQIRDYVAAHPNATPTEIAEAMGVNRQYVYTVMFKVKQRASVKKGKKKVGRPRKVTEASENLLKLAESYKQARLAKKENWKQIGLFSSNVPMVKDTTTKLSPNRMAQLAFEASKSKIRMEGNRADPVNHPTHYKVGGIETIDFIEAKKLGYNLGNVVKYITRSDHKGNRLQDLRKAQWYLEREIWNAEDNKKTA